VRHLTSCLLTKAFRGELVEQDPNDELADKVLERMRKAREKG
jgi:type I restriction enzyme, S subunit